MKITIKYCRPCGYRGHAERLADRFQSEFDARTTLVPGNFGVFKIWLDDRLIFDKRQTRGLLGKLGFGVVPGDDELLSLARAQRAAKQ